MTRRPRTRDEWKCCAYLVLGWVLAMLAASWAGSPEFMR